MEREAYRRILEKTVVLDLGTLAFILALLNTYRQGRDVSIAGIQSADALMGRALSISGVSEEDFHEAMAGALAVADKETHDQALAAKLSEYANAPGWEDDGSPD